MPKKKNIKVMIIEDNKRYVFCYSSYSDAYEGFVYLLREILEKHLQARHLFMLAGTVILREYHHYYKPISIDYEKYI